MTKEIVQRIFILPDGLMQKDLLVLTLKNPKTGGDFMCAIDNTNKLYEIVHYGEDISSWFIGESVSDTGNLFFLTQADPLFFILPFADKCPGKYCPIEDLLTDEEYPDIHYLSKCCMDGNLKTIFDFKESSGYEVYSYNKTKTLHWLQQKAKVLATKLASKDIDLSDGSKASLLKSDDNLKNEAEYLKYSCDLISDYLSCDLSSELFSSLGIQQKSSAAEAKTPEKILKKKNTSVKPEDDYCINFKNGPTKSKQNGKLTTAQKQLMKVDKSGMKSISSFFVKKG